MRVSMSLPSQDWSLCGPAARQAEEDGFDSVQSNELKYDPFAPLAFAALATAARGAEGMLALKRKRSAKVDPYIR